MKVVGVIITRNLPELADELYAEIKDLVPEVYFIENGTDRDKISANANICFEESKGVSWAVNYAVQKACDEGYDAAWISYNDARFANYKAYLDWSVKMFSNDSRLAVTTGYWPDVWACNADKNPAGRGHKGDILIGHFSPLSFMVTTESARKIAEVEKRCTPFWDSENYPAHMNTLSTGAALAGLGMYMMTSTEHPVTEKDVFLEEDKEELSESARGMNDTDWKQKFGPKARDTWLDNYFPQLSGKGLNHKQKRDILIHNIGKAFTESYNNGRK